jgi:simple sugar transport system ATP-binding protein
MAEPAIELIGINKSFGPVHANRDINLEIPRHDPRHHRRKRRRQVDADVDPLRLLHRPIQRRDPRQRQAGLDPTPNDAIAHGIGMVHQHFMLVDNFTVLENVILGAEAEALLKSSISKARASWRLEARIWLEVDPDADDRGTAGRPPAACRNPEGALSRRRYPDPRRADRRADAGRGRPPVPHPRRC